VAAAGPRLAFVWQAQCTEPSGGDAARVAGFRVAGAVHRIFWRSCCARERFAWHVWHLAAWTFVLRDRRGTW